MCVYVHVMNARGVPIPPDKEKLPANNINAHEDGNVLKRNAACCNDVMLLEEKHRSVKNLLAGTSKAKAGKQKATAVNAWPLAQGSYKRQKLC